MDNKRNFNWEQVINVNKDVFLECFSKADSLSRSKRLLINLIDEDRSVGVYFSSASYLGFLNKINDMEHEIIVLKNKN